MSAGCEIPSTKMLKDNGDSLQTPTKQSGGSLQDSVDTPVTKAVRNIVEQTLEKIDSGDAGTKNLLYFLF